MKVLFFTGKGGVGKSTLAAAAAFQLSRKHRVLIVSLDPAHNLGDIFGVALKDEKNRFSDTLFLKEVDLQKRAKDYLQKEIQVLSSTYRYLQAFNLDQYFSVLRYSPGLEEYALLSSIEETVREEGDLDRIIFDTPPTGLTLRFLALPRVTNIWIDRLTGIREKILEKRHTIQKIKGGLKEEVVLKYDPGADEVLNRLCSMKEKYQFLNQVLQGETTSIVLVFNPDILSLRESQRLIDGLRDLNLPLRLLIDNKVSAENEGIAERVERELQRKVQGVPLERVLLSRELQGGDGKKLYDIPEDIASRL
jgi:arsenite/tail-anchored protein-transporting ATPase